MFLIIYNEETIKIHLSYTFETVQNQAEIFFLSYYALYKFTKCTIGAENNDNNHYHHFKIA